MNVLSGLNVQKLSVAMFFTAGKIAPSLQSGRRDAIERSSYKRGETPLEPTNFACSNECLAIGCLSDDIHKIPQLSTMALCVVV
jgi:hypothetical protein